MDLLEAIRRQRSVPTFRADPVRPEHLKLLVEAAARSPSHFNSQPWRFVVITDEALRLSLDELLQFSSTAPLRLGIGLNRAEYKPGELQGLYSAITLGAVIETFSLVSASLGMGFQWLEMGAQQEALATHLKMNPDWELVSWFALGYVQENPSAPAPPPFEALVSDNRWEKSTPETLRRAPSLLWAKDSLKK